MSASVAIVRGDREGTQARAAAERVSEVKQSVSVPQAAAGAAGHDIVPIDWTIVHDNVIVSIL